MGQQQHQQQQQQPQQQQPQQQQQQQQQQPQQQQQQQQRHQPNTDTAKSSQTPASEEIDELLRRPTLCLPYIPGITEPMRRIAKKAGLKLTNKSGTTMKNILCGPN